MEQRQIKFRIWDGERVIYQDGNRWFNDVKVLTNPVKQTIRLDTAIDLQLTVMQYVGLKDKNNKDIYESDILECFDDSIYNKREKERLLVIWDNGRSCFRLKDTSDSFSFYATLEVIGNQYETPKLLTPTKP